MPEEIPSRREEAPLVERILYEIKKVIVMIEIFPWLIIILLLGIIFGLLLGRPGYPRM